MLIQAMLCDTMDRFHYAHGEPPKRMRGSRFLGYLLEKELLDQGVPMKFDPEYAGKQALEPGEFEYRGVVVRCDLPTEIPTVIAESPAPNYAGNSKWL